MPSFFSIFRCIWWEKECLANAEQGTANSSIKKLSLSVCRTTQIKFYNLGLGFSCCHWDPVVLNVNYRCFRSIAWQFLKLPKRQLTAQDYTDKLAQFRFQHFPKFPVYFWSACYGSFSKPTNVDVSYIFSFLSGCFRLAFTCKLHCRPRKVWHI